MRVILALFLHMCSGSFGDRQASHSMHWLRVQEGKWRDSGGTWLLSSHGGSSPVEERSVPLCWVLALWQKYIFTGSLKKFPQKC